MFSTVIHWKMYEKNIVSSGDIITGKFGFFPKEIKKQCKSIETSEIYKRNYRENIHNDVTTVRITKDEETH